MKRTRVLSEVEETNAALQALDRATERLDRGQLIAEEKERARKRVEEEGGGGGVGGGMGGMGDGGGKVGGVGVSAVRLVDVSRQYVKHGFGDEERMHATSKLNAREKKKSDRYCK